MLQHIQPPDLFRSSKLGFTQVVTATAGAVVWVAGQTACDERGRPVGAGDIGKQAEVALENVRRALAAAGAGPADVTMLRVYIVGFTHEAASEIGGRVASFFAGVEPPASTWVGVTALMHPDFLIEIEAVAAVPAAS
ncbi:MAG TPA: RidA family protein [Candidatus Binatia bacterium]|jgi:enamine deaminase RidA (YjgF/YER057c/UK114 family)